MDLTKDRVYRVGWEWAKAGKPRVPHHRVTTENKPNWYAGWDAFKAGGDEPYQPTKRLTDEEKAIRGAKPSKPMHPALWIRDKNTDPKLYDKYTAIYHRIDGASDSENMEELYKQISDVRWNIIGGASGSLPSEKWEEYKANQNWAF